MAVGFILGRSGTGKTSYCVGAVADALAESAVGGRLILLVPEQATYQAERAILADERVAGFNRLNVLSFDRLQFLLSGRNTARPGLSRLGRQMVVDRLLREHKERLEVLGSSVGQLGLAREVAGAIAELHRYAKSPEDVERLVGELGGEEHNRSAALKFGDVGLIFKEYLKFIEGKYIDPDVQLNDACRLVAEAEFVKGAKLWVDGFASFTGSELAILVELLKAASDAKIALCLDGSKIDLKNPGAGKLDEVSLFSPTERTYAELVEVIRKCKLELAEPIVLEEAVRFSDCGALCHIERNMFELEPAKFAVEGGVRIVSAADVRAEVRFVAREILRLVKEEGYRYRDIGVIASDIEGYQHYVRAYFEDYGVPFFIDKRKPLNQHPVVELICSALEVVVGGFSHGDIFAYLKTGLVPVEDYEVHLLENYCLAFGVGGGEWLSGEDWGFQGAKEQRFDEGRINEIRWEVSGPLLGLRKKLYPDDDSGRKISAGEFAQIVFDFLDELKVAERVGGWIEEAAGRGDVGAAGEHQQFYEKLVDIFDELAEVFSGREERSEDYCVIIDSAFSQLTLAFIPPSLDQVLVGSIERSRHPDLKAVFLMGATQRQFPVPVEKGGILSDEDRRAAESADFVLGGTVGQRLAERQYLAYIAFTRPSRFLCITYPLADDKGSAAVRSQFVANLESLFEDLNEETAAGEQVDIEKVHSEGEFADLLCGSREFDGLLEEVCLDEQLAGIGERVKRAVGYDNRAQLDEEVTKELFGGQVRSSATRLGTYAACPYRYFAKYILGLEERKEFKLEPLDVGIFYHKVLDALLKRLAKEGKDFATIGDDELAGVLRERISAVVGEDSFISNFVRRGGHNTYIINSAGGALENCAAAIAEMVRAGKFRPECSEVSFGQVEGSVESLGEYELGLSDNRRLFLDGKIDRIDAAEAGGKKAAIIFDYKRRDRAFSWSKFYYGLDMQLGIYMLAAAGASACRYKDVVGAFYMPVEVSPAKVEFGKLAEQANKFLYKAKGIFNGEFFEQLDSSDSNRFYNFFVTKKGDQYGYENRSGALRPVDFEKVLRFTEGKIVELTEQIVSGGIEVRPYRLGGESPCRYCEYRAVCRFDWQVNEYNFLETLSKSECLRRG